MKRRNYWIAALVLAVLLTVAQGMIANVAVRKNMQVLYAADRDIMKGTVLTKEMVRRMEVYSETPLPMTDLAELEGKTVLFDITEGSLLSLNDMHEREDSGDIRFMSLSVDLSSFNAGDIKNRDMVDLFIIPDLGKVRDHELVWLIHQLSACGIRYVPWDDGGIILKNIPVAYVNTQSGQSRKVVSLRLVKPMDAVLAFLKTVSTVEVIRN
ncbi:MAG: hypothetical protein R6W96_05790 [Clostridia bacterium]